MNDRQILIAALKWHTAREFRLAALRELARACTKARGDLHQADDATEVIDLLCLPC